MPVSGLQHNPKSVVQERGYINVYSPLNSKERRQLYYKTRYKKENPNWEETQTFLSRYFAANLPVNCVLLDAGCGNGNYVVDENRPKISWACGTDLSPEYFKKNVCLDEIKVGSVYDLPYPGQKFDCVLSLWVLEHLEYPEKMFSEVYRVLKKGGYFMFATPCKYYLLLLLKEIKGVGMLSDQFNQKVLGREEKDIFKTYYKANSLKEISSLAADKFRIEILKYNFDPSYTSVNESTYKVTCITHSVFRAGKITFPHLLGILRKI